MADKLSDEEFAERFDSVFHRLRPDFENQPAWVRAEVTALVMRFDGLPEEERAKAVADNISDRLRRYYFEEGIKRAVTAAGLVEGVDFTDKLPEE